MFKVSHVQNRDLACCEGIMRRIYDEKPVFWPHGLSTRHFDGGLWLVKKSSNDTPVGFVGWQLRHEDGKKVGYYSVGILPEWRQHGLAKEAVTKILAKQAAEVDVVRALIDHRNEPSQALAAALHTCKPLEVKLASILGGISSAFKSELGKKIVAGLGHTASGVGSGVFWDQVMHPDAPIGESFQPQNWDKRRQLLGLFNALVGGAGVHTIRRGLREGKGGMIVGGAGTVGLLPAKDWIMKSMPLLDDTQGLIKDVKGRANRPPSPLLNMDPKILMALGGAGALGLGALGYAGLRTGNAMKSISDKQRGGTIRVTLPTKHPGDAETQVEMPIEDVQLSNNLYRALGRDTRRRLRSESGERKLKFLTEQQRSRNLGINMDDDARIINEPQAVA